MKPAATKVVDNNPSDGYLTWCVMCYTAKRGEYPRFSSRNKDQIEFWLEWCQRNEPELLPRLQLCKLVPVVSEVNHDQA